MSSGGWHWRETLSPAGGRKGGFLEVVVPEPSLREEEDLAGEEGVCSGVSVTFFLPIVTCFLIRGSRAGRRGYGWSLVWACVSSAPSNQMGV